MVASAKASIGAKSKRSAINKLLTSIANFAATKQRACSVYELVMGIIIPTMGEYNPYTGIDTRQYTAGGL